MRKANISEIRGSAIGVALGVTLKGAVRCVQPVKPFSSIKY